MPDMLRKLPLLFLVFALAACSAAPARKSQAGLDDLFSQLRTTASAEEASRLQVAILNAWGSSGREDVDRLMREGSRSLQAGELERARRMFTEVISRAPDFAEGYNMRAAAAVLAQDTNAALLDIDKVLRLEPRHFGALSGLGHIFLMLNQDKAALKAFEAALAVNPHLQSVRIEADRLRNQVAGTSI